MNMAARNSAKCCIHSHHQQPTVPHPLLSGRATILGSPCQAPCCCSWAWQTDIILLREPLFRLLFLPLLYIYSIINPASFGIIHSRHFPFPVSTTTVVTFDSKNSIFSTTYLILITTTSPFPISITIQHHAFHQHFRGHPGYLSPGCHGSDLH
jgi:hypothetical protein